MKGIEDFNLEHWISDLLKSLEPDISCSTGSRATPVGPTRNTSPTYSPGIHGWDYRWLELLVAGYPPSSSHSSSSSHLKSQPCILGEYVGLVFLSIGAAGIAGVALVSAATTTYETLGGSQSSPSALR